MHPPFGIKSRRRGAHDFGQSSAAAQKELAPDHDFGDIRTAMYLISPVRRDTGPPSLAGFVFLGFGKLRLSAKLRH